MSKERKPSWPDGEDKFCICCERLLLGRNPCPVCVFGKDDETWCEVHGETE